MSFARVDPEFVAVVQAATVGSRLFPLGRVGHPKHLLDAAGVPMLERLFGTVLVDFANVYVAIASDDHATVPAVFEGRPRVWSRVGATEEHGGDALANNNKNTGDQGGSRMGVSTGSATTIIHGTNSTIPIPTVHHVAKWNTHDKERKDKKESTSFIRSIKVVVRMQ